jgi:hypothetical protein
MPLECEDTVRLVVDALSPGEVWRGEDGWMVRAGLLSSKGMGLVVVSALSCSRIIRIDRTRLSCITNFHELLSWLNSEGRLDLLQV